MSRRSRRRREVAAPERGVEAGGRATEPSAGGHAPSPTWPLAVQIALLVAVFAAVVLLAELAGAANLGVSLGIGQIAFALAVVYLLLRR